MLYKYGEPSREFLGIFENFHISLVFQNFEAFLIKQLFHSRLLAIYYLTFSTPARGITVKYTKN